MPPYGGEETHRNSATMSNPEEAHHYKYCLSFTEARGLKPGGG
ncbi:MAG TPA: hypothetical protein VGV59_10135 [Pyrinomonadaceae bacterium]|nr:hypothetical protein [Pyrinomonadaceae bacterium]